MVKRFCDRCNTQIKEVENVYRLILEVKIQDNSKKDFEVEVNDMCEGCANIISKTVKIEPLLPFEI